MPTITKHGDCLKNLQTDLKLVALAKGPAASKPKDSTMLTWLEKLCWEIKRRG